MASSPPQTAQVAQTLAAINRAKASYYSRGARTPHRAAKKEKMIAALYVMTGGPYFGITDVDPWDIVRDARTYAGPFPVIAHPPCQRWGKMWFGQPLTVKRTGIRKKKGDDGGCFKAALSSVRKWGGVLEHPWGSHAWKHFGLTIPPRSGEWVRADGEGGYTCCVEQGQYGHYARKPTLLYAFGVDLPGLRWGHTEAKLDPAVIARMGLKRAKRLGEVGSRGGGTDSAARIHTPEEFRDVLLNIARSRIVREERPGEHFGSAIYNSQQPQAKTGEVGCGR